MPRYVILRHELPPESGRASHWDVMLEERAESGEVVLKTWAVERSPDDLAPQPALRLPDHRAAYLTYEGPVSGGRGEVARWDEGAFELIGDSAGGVGGDMIEAKVVGRRLRGRISLQRRTTDEPDRFDYRYVPASRGDV
jgi:hypothetical protein